MRRALSVISLVLWTTAAAAQTQPSAQFDDGANSAKIAENSGLVCPERIGVYMRDAVGERDQSGGVFCSYYGFDGIYGTIRVTPLNGLYAPLTAFAPDFAMEEGTGAKVVSQSSIALGPQAAPRTIFERNYETSHLESQHYRTAYTGAAIKGWAVETVSEYAEPRDNGAQRVFLDWAYGPAANDLRPYPAQAAKP